MHPIKDSAPDRPIRSRYPTKFQEPVDFTLKSKESINQAKIVIHNQSNSKVEIIWLNYEGNEVKFNEILPKCKCVFQTYLTHPWIFRNSAIRNLVPIDALIADHLDLYSLYKYNNYRLNRRFLSGSRIFLPVKHEENDFILIIIKNGVYSLQENCMNTLINYFQTYLVSKYLPSNLRDNFEAHINGQSYREFIN